MPLRRLLLPASLLCALPFPAHAGEEAYFEDLPVVLTASRLPQPVNEAPGAVTVIDRAFIKATGYRNLARIFRLVPGMQVGQERGNANWVTYHGLSSTFPSEMQVLIDGRSVYSPASFGGVDWQSLPITVDDIERIEILRGSNAVTYGANAFLGVINIITRHSAEAPDTHASISGGSPGVFDAGAGTGGRIAGADYMLNVQRKRDSGFEDMYDSTDTRLVSVRSDYRISPRDELSLRMAGSDSWRQEGYPSSVNSNNATRNSHSQNYTVHTQWNHTPQAGNEWLFHYYRNQERIVERWDAHGPSSRIFPAGPVVPIDLDRVAIRDHLEMQNRRALTQDVQAVWGLEGRRDEVHAPYLYAGRASTVTQMARLFGNTEWKFAPAWQLSSGAAVEAYEREPVHFAPRLFLNWQASRSDTLRAGVARAWTQRPTFEKEGDVRAIEPVSGLLIQNPYQPNENLKQARVDSIEAGYLGRFRPMASSLDVRVFRERITDFIYRRAVRSPLDPLLNSVNDSAQYVNAKDPVILTGVEYQFKWTPWRGGEWMFNHTLIRTQAMSLLQNRVAPYVATLSWRQDWGAGWSSMISGMRMGPLAGGDGMVPIYRYVAPAYTSFDARIAWAQRLSSGQRIEYSLNGINLGKRHQEIADRSQQSLYGSEPANRVSPMIYAAVSLAL
ncbi:TonB-dependent receptor plug domain-containing protein [Uliginosibacterium paludis]|uniref:TonB-dependent receptor plug domain-containing protein n=1 Tax=Uliginosibacterium paludis TaxID=1615952 RepID=A0ABV2CST2_9RHOO